MKIHTATAQPRSSEPWVDIARAYALRTYGQWQLSNSDVQEMRLSDHYTDGSSGAAHVYFQQTSGGIPVYNAILGIHLRGEAVVHANSRFIPGLSSRIEATKPVVGAGEALCLAAAHLNLPCNGSPLLTKTDADGTLHFDKGTIGREDIAAHLCYVKTRNGRVRLAWNIALDLAASEDYWNVRVDAVNGDVLEKNNWTTHCQPADLHDGCDDAPANTAATIPATAATPLAAPMPAGGAPIYNVFALPVESPIHGNRSLLVDPADPVASPFGWHDTNGALGAEYTVTRGNNAHAYFDANNDNQPDPGSEADGTSALFFDFPFNPLGEPDVNAKAAVTNLFYTNNFMHDFLYRNGFDEAAGNFQQNNYGKGGKEADYVRAEGQDANKAATPSYNNANFLSPPDGTTGRMQMYLWNLPGDIVRIDAPANISGNYDSRGTFGWGKPVSTTPVSGQVVNATDNSNFPNTACNGITNDLTGKIALVDRGLCDFSTKALNAQKKGAIGCIVCNYDETFANMGPGADGASVTIPVAMVKQSVCQAIRQLLASGTAVSASLVLLSSALPQQLDACFDNGTIAHEYAHGLSNRLTGGPAQAGCLGNTEQMGEGWSDFFALAATARPGDTGTKPRGMTTYTMRQNANKGGVRAYPYSTDMNANPHTYNDIIYAPVISGVPSVHYIGEVWCSMLWDLYWALSDQYGWSSDPVNGKGGNNMAIRLVIQGMKLQPCSPGFVDARDAILAADRVLYQGANECLIWDVFARRGLGFNADQGDSESNTDGRESFDRYPPCQQRLALEKKVTDLVEAGQEITCTLKATNYKKTKLTGLVLTDTLPAATTFVAGSASNGGTFANNLVTFRLDSLGAGASQTFTYRIKTPVDKKSVRKFYDDMESAPIKWRIESLNGINKWTLQTQSKVSGQFAWSISDQSGGNDQVITLINPVTVSGTRPALRFYHNFDIQPGADGGFVQVSADDGQTWDDLPSDRFYRQGYSGKLGYPTLLKGNINAYWGNSNGWVASYADLDKYLGKNIKLRFRFASDLSVYSKGWLLDDVEIFDLFNYLSGACITAQQGDQACATPDGRGTVVNTTAINSTEGPADVAPRVAMYPNPSNGLVTLRIEGTIARELDLHVFSSEGQLVGRHRLEYAAPENTFDWSYLPAGIYFVRINMDDTVLIHRLVKY